MTRRDYIRIAAALREAAERTWSGAPDEDEQRAMLYGQRLAREAIADALAADNPRFDRERFIAAAEGGKA